MLMLAAHRCPDAESTALVRGVLLRSGYRPKKAERLGRAAHLSEMHAFCAMSILLRTGQVRVRVRVRVSSQTCDVLLSEGACPCGVANQPRRLLIVAEVRPRTLRGEFSKGALLRTQA